MSMQTITSNVLEWVQSRYWALWKELISITILRTFHGWTKRKRRRDEKWSVNFPVDTFFFQWCSLLLTAKCQSNKFQAKKLFHTFNEWICRVFFSSFVQMFFSSLSLSISSMIIGILPENRIIPCDRYT